MHTIPVSCDRDCGAGCPLLAHVDDGRLLSIANNPAGGPFMTGCAKGFQAHLTVNAPDRLRAPLIRTGRRGAGEFREASWDEALDLVAGRLADIRAQHGAEAIMHLGGSGSCRASLHNTHLLTARFLALFGGYTRTTSNYSAAAVNFVLPYIFGTSEVGFDPATLEHSRLIILWGANLADTRFSCELPAHLREARRRGVPIIVIDPRRAATVARYGAEWIPCRPGTDAALMMAVLYVWINENLIDLDYVERRSIGFDALRRRVMGEDNGVVHSPEWAESICATPADTITRFARLYGTTKPAALIPGFSIQRTVGGEETYRLTAALQLAAGNTGVPGGSSGGKFLSGLAKPRVGRIPVPDTSHLPGVPVLEWPDAILSGRAGGYPTDIRAIYNVGGNYLVQGSDMRKSMRAFEQVDFAVCHDYFLTPTAQYCDVVLPATHFLEREDIVAPSVGNYLFYSHRAVEPPAGARHDYDIFCDLAGRLGFGDAYSEGKDAEMWLRQFLHESDIPEPERFRESGIYMDKDQTRVGLADFAADPAGRPLATPSGKIELQSARFARDTGFSSIPECRPLLDDPTYPLRMVTPKSAHRTHSQGSNIPAITAREAHALWIHPADAGSRGIADGDLVRVISAEGQMRIGSRVTADIMPGVVSLCAGVWPIFDDDGIEIAGSVNILTSTAGTLPSRGARTHSIAVQVARAGP
jgi:anaerobic dimethyl sulfoxide reductase subunit A